LAQSGLQLRRRWVFGAIAVVVFLGIALSSLSGFYVDLLWFREVDFGGVFWSVYWSKVVLGVIFGTVFFLLLAANLFIARRFTPRFRPFSPEQEVIERYRMAFEPYARPIILGFSAIIALFVGIAASAQWQTFLLWKSAGSVGFGQMDPLFHRDPSFYIFILPFQKFVQGWLFSALVGVTVITAIAHYLSGGIRLQSVGEKVTPQVKAHLSVLLGFIVLVKSWGYFLGKFDLLVSPRGVVTGASYTDVHAQLPALRVLTFIAIACAILFLVNIRFRGWALPGFGVGLLILASIVVGGIVPAFVQRFRVTPQELQRETPFIERNISATRFAFDIGLEPQAVRPSSTLTPEDIEANEATVSNIRLWRPGVIIQTYQALQRIQPYYEFEDVDVDRYPIEGERRLVMLSAREVRQAGIPGTAGWQQRHLVYTHGYGAVASRVNSADASGAPTFVLRDIPPVGSGVELQRPPEDQGAQVYYGENANVPYVVVGTGQQELNYPDPGGGGFVPTTYRGKGGIQMRGYLRRLLFAYKYRDVNLLISGLIHSDSRILINRDLKSRVRKAAPFLRYDGDPYAAVVDGRIVWIWDAYTTTDLYPYSSRINLSAATNGDLGGIANYMRNSVKAVVDAYDGTLTFYVVDPEDPIIQLWQRAFPDLFTPMTEAPANLVAHFRYPENLMQVQAFQYGRYHVTNVPAFFNNSERWAVPPALPGQVQEKSQGSLRPYYVLTKLPGNDDEQFVLFMPLTPTNRPNMVAYMTGGSDPGEYGRMRVFEFPTGVNIDGPAQVRSQINQDATVSQQITLLSQRESQVLYGDLIVVPLEDSFLYVQPLFVTAVTGQTPIPELKRVIIVKDGEVNLGNTLPEALAAAFGEAQPPPAGGGGPPPTGDVARLLQEALTHFQLAQQALQNQDLATYQAEVNKARDLIQQAAQLANQTPGPSPSPSPTASP
jgi:uncharacterized protein